MKKRHMALFPIAATLCVGAGLVASDLLGIAPRFHIPIVSEALAPFAKSRLALAKPRGGTAVAALEPSLPSDGANAEAAGDWPLTDGDSPVQPELALPPAGVAEALAAYRAGDLAAGDAAAAGVDDPNARVALEWAALRLQPGAAGLTRIHAFLSSHKDWPTQSLRRRAEEILWTDKKSADAIEAFFANHAPETAMGKLARARALMARGQIDAAAVLAREVWRDEDFYQAYEPAILKDFGDYLTWDDDKRRSDRMFYKDNAGASARAAAYAGADVAAFASARASGNEKAIAALPPELLADPTLAFARARKLLRDNKPMEAAKAVFAAPKAAQDSVGGDEWWTLRRQIARKLLDLGDPRTAYRLCADGVAAARDQRIDEEFHAGWIALRFLADPATAAARFAAAEPLAITPISAARIAYWRGRAAEASGQSEAATGFYETAAKNSTAFYGQLSLARLGHDSLPIRRPDGEATGGDRAEAIRAIELLEAVDARDIAAPLAGDFAKTSDDAAQLAALGAVLVSARDARLALAVGKIASQRGYALDELAYPTFGIPRFDPVDGSAPKALVYAIARQESAFDSKAVSSAGAKGLMQMMPATARMTAAHKKLDYDDNRLISDPAYNAMLGAAHLGELAQEQHGSNILMFAAYNAGGKRVREWIAAHGDPRDPAIDPVDWIELIPIDETRNYVQRIAENLEVYRARLGGAPKLAIESTLREAVAARM